jgi:hypothetical protein
VKVGRRLGLECGHFTETEISDDFDVSTMHEMVETSDELEYMTFCSPHIYDDAETRYCDKCNDMKKIKRINLFLVERDPMEIT